jgi:hypothetical protein
VVAERGQVVHGLPQPVGGVGDDAVHTGRLTVDQDHRQATAQLDHLVAVEPGGADDDTVDAVPQVRDDLPLAVGVEVAVGQDDGVPLVPAQPLGGLDEPGEHGVGDVGHDDGDGDGRAGRLGLSRCRWRVAELLRNPKNLAQGVRTKPFRITERPGSRRECDIRTLGDIGERGAHDSSSSGSMQES